MKKLRLMVTDKCPRNCELCCNKHENNVKLIAEAPVYEPGKEKYEEILVTGGEPMYMDNLTVILSKLKAQNPHTDLYLYTAGNDDASSLYMTMFYLDGLCLTLHTQEDVEHFKDFVFLINTSPIPEHFKKMSLRLNIFKGIKVPKELTKRWVVKSNIEWELNCPLPEGEVFMKYKEV